MAKGKTKILHADGSKCPEGTQLIPKGFTACCLAFDQRTKACYFDFRIEWWVKRKGWFVTGPPQSGGGGISIIFCPHCGTKLADGLKPARNPRKFISRD
jgi:hypothetical protein